ncbi:MAG: acylneuraminate cytidylyltransferase family protein [Burkholderiales bacterium]|nr:acylneuraminate cytidylyltransferase family protein [Burkholderiales bacterium]
MPICGRTVVALIPARGGSRGVKRKNLRVVAGRPLIEFTLMAASKSHYIDSVHVSSDDDEILGCGRALGANTVVRPAEYASDTASAVEVVNHFLTVIPRQLRKQDPYIVYLQPTSPLRTASHIDEALEMMVAQKAHTLVSVTELKASPFKSFVLDSNRRLQSLFDEKLSNAQRQDLPSVYIPNGAIYVFRVSDFIERGGFPSNGSLPFIMSEKDSVDVDTEEDIHRLKNILETSNG